MQSIHKMSTDVAVCIPEDNEDTDDENICVICLESLHDDTSTFSCNHVIHEQCAIPYFIGKFEKNEHITCPTCRFLQCSSYSDNYKKYRQELGIVDSNNREYTEIDIVANDENENQTQQAGYSLVYYIATSISTSVVVMLSCGLMFLVIYCGINGPLQKN